MGTITINSDELKQLIKESWAGYYQQYIELHREVIGVYTFDTGQVLT